MDVSQILKNLSDLQRLSRKDLRLTADQKASVARIRCETPAPILAHFDRMLAKGMKGVAEARHGVCSGCHLKLPAAVLLNEADDLRLCENCGAYLIYAPEGARAALAR